MESDKYLKRGFFSLLVSFIFGALYLFFCLADVHSFYTTKAFEFFSRIVMLPELKLPGYVIMIILALVLNLLAMIVSMPSMAVGAAVFYGISVGFNPDCYPYVAAEFFFCLIAAVRMRERSARDGSLEERDRAVRSAEAKRSEVISAMSGSGKAGKTEPVQIHFTDYSEYTNAKKKNDAFLKKMEQGERSDSRVRTFVTIFVVTISLVALAAGLVSVMTANRNSKTRQTEWSWKSLVTDPGAFSLNGNTGSIDLGGKTGSAVSNGKSDTADSGGKSDVADLSGYWTMPGESTTRLGAEIRDDTIDVYWLMDGGRKILYWSGSYEAPQTSDLPYTWLSKRNEEKTKNESFVQKDDYKEFTYNGNSLRFSISSSSSNLFVSLQRSLSLT